jgi:hypothetical protein
VAVARPANVTVEIPLQHGQRNYPELVVLRLDICNASSENLYIAHVNATKDYLDKNRTYNDVAETLSSYPSLSVRTELYTYENGQSALLVNLTGTLPVEFRGATYGFPIAGKLTYAFHLIRRLTPKCGFHINTHNMLPSST